MAEEPAAALLLVGLGLDELSMSAASMLMVKKILRNVQYSDAVRRLE